MKSNEALGANRNALGEIRDELQGSGERGCRPTGKNIATISMQLAEIGEAIKELRPLGEACQEEKKPNALALAEKRLHLQHLAENLREKYDAD